MLFLSTGRQMQGFGPKYLSIRRFLSSARMNSVRIRWGEGRGLPVGGSCGRLVVKHTLYYAPEWPGTVPCYAAHCAGVTRSPRQPFAVDLGKESTARCWSLPGRFGTAGHHCRLAEHQFDTYYQPICVPSFRMTSSPNRFRRPRYAACSAYRPPKRSPRTSWPVLNVEPLVSGENCATL